MFFSVFSLIYLSSMILFLRIINLLFSIINGLSNWALTMYRSVSQLEITPDLCMLELVWYSRHHIVHRPFHAIAINVHWNCPMEIQIRDKCISWACRPSQYSMRQLHSPFDLIWSKVTPWASIVGRFPTFEMTKWNKNDWIRLNSAVQHINAAIRNALHIKLRSKYASYLGLLIFTG